VLAGIFMRREFETGTGRSRHHRQRSATQSGPETCNSVYFASWRTDVAALLPVLKRVAPWLRSQVAQALPLRYTPELSFSRTRAGLRNEDQPTDAET